MAVLIEAGYAIRTIKIRYGDNIGSAVVLGDGEHVRMVATAAHLLAGAHAGDRVALRHKDVWEFIDIEFIAFDEKGADACVFVPTTQWGEGLPYSWLLGEIIFGEEVSFLGFPLGLEIEPIVEVAYPTALLKTGVFSGAIRENGEQIYLFDAINNVGFSGGPVFRRNAKGELSIVGIVSGYLYDRPQPVFEMDPARNEKPSSTHFVKANSGFMKVVPSFQLRRLVDRLVRERGAAQANKVKTSE